MRRLIIAVLCPVLILTVLTVRYVASARTAKNGDQLLLPVSVLETGEDAFSPFVRLRYHNFIPINAMLEKKGTIIVERTDGGRTEFSSLPSKRPLRPRETLLKYTVTDDNGADASVRFSATFLRFSKTNGFLPESVRFAVVRADKSGDALLTGLADANGTLLVKGIAQANRSR